VDFVMATMNARKAAHEKTQKTPVKQALIAHVVFENATRVMRATTLSRR